MEDSVGPTEVIYGSQYKHFIDILFINVNLRRMVCSVYTIYVYCIYYSTHMNNNLKQHKTTDAINNSNWL